MSKTTEHPTLKLLRLLSEAQELVAENGNGSVVWERRYRLLGDLANEIRDQYGCKRCGSLEHRIICPGKL